MIPVTLHRELEPYYGDIGRPDPELMIRMLIAGNRYGTRSERKLCQEVPALGFASSTWMTTSVGAL